MGEIPFGPDENGDIVAVVGFQRFLDGDALGVAFKAVGDEFEPRLGMTDEVLD